MDAKEAVALIGEHAQAVVSATHKSNKSSFKAEEKTARALFQSLVGRRPTEDELKIMTA